MEKLKKKFVARAVDPRCHVYPQDRQRAPNAPRGLPCPSTIDMRCFRKRVYILFWITLGYPWGAGASGVYNAVRSLYPTIRAGADELIERWVFTSMGDNPSTRVAVRIWPMWMARQGSTHPGLLLDDPHTSKSRDDTAQGLLHFVHVPKAGGSRFTSVLRRIAGCHPAGMCCKGLGTPLGVCPSFHQYCAAIQGCAGHRSAMEMVNGNRGKVPSFIMMRDPVDRAVSGYFYAGHGPTDTAACPFTSCYQNATAAEGARWVNVAAKMLCNHMPYENVVPSRKHALDMLAHMDFVGISELWASSLAVLYMTFPGADRSPLDFHMPGGGARSNSNIEYAAFRMQALSPEVIEATKRANNIDMDLYFEAVRLLCVRLAAFSLWDMHEIQAEISRLENHTTRQICRAAAEEALALSSPSIVL